MGNCNKPMLYKTSMYDTGVFVFAPKCFVDKDRVDFLICTSLCGQDEEQVVDFEFNGIKYTVLNKYGEPLKLKELRPRKIYHGLFSSTIAPGTILLTNSGRC